MVHPGVLVDLSAQEAAPVRALLAQDLGGLEVRQVIDHQGPTLPRGDVLGVMPALGGKAAESTQWRALPTRAQPMGVVLHQGDPPWLEQRAQFLDPRGYPAVMHDEDRARSVGEGSRHSVRVKVEGVLQDVDEDRGRPGQRHRGGCRGEGERRDDRLVTRAEPDQPRGHVQGVRAGRGHQGTGRTQAFAQPVGGALGHRPVAMPDRAIEDLANEVGLGPGAGGLGESDDRASVGHPHGSW